MTPAVSTEEEKTKFCEGPCHRTLLVNCFSLNRSGQPGEMGRQRLCKACANAYMKLRYDQFDGAAKKKAYRKLVARRKNRIDTRIY